MAIYENTELTPREHMLMEHDANEARLKREYAVTVKQLELELAREKYKAEIELKRLESKWSSWLKLPSTVIKLPIYILFAVAYIVSIIRKQELPKNFWAFMK